MKLIFEEAYLELIEFFGKDIITTSPADETEYDEYDDKIGENDGEPDMEGC